MKSFGEVTHEICIIHILLKLAWINPPQNHIYKIESFAQINSTHIQDFMLC